MITLMLFFLVTYVLYRRVFYYSPKKRVNPADIPDDELYRDHKDKLMAAIDDMEKAEWTDAVIASEDGEVLAGRYLLTGPGRPLVLFFHGYHGTYMWDGYGCYRICRKLGYNILMVDERAHGQSSGHTITFGVKECRDCLSWIAYAKEHIEYSKLYLWGVSMGAATVLDASRHLGCDEVAGIISECAYTSPEAVIRRTGYAMDIPIGFLFPGVRAAAAVFGHFKLSAESPVEAVRNTDIPILFIHGEKDGFVPYKMSEILYDACSSTKRIAGIADSGHAVCALCNPDAYRTAVEDFLNEY